MLKVLAYSFIFSIIIRIVNRQGNRKRPVSRRFIKILMVDVSPSCWAARQAGQGVEGSPSLKDDTKQSSLGFLPYT